MPPSASFLNWSPPARVAESAFQMECKLSHKHEIMNDKGEYAQAWNFGPTEEDCKPVAWIVEEMARMWGKEAKWKIDSGEHPHEANFLKLNVSKARNQLDWKPTMRLADALERII